MSDVISPQITEEIFDTYMGGMLIGVVVQSIFYGVASTLFWTYHRNWKRDSWFIRSVLTIAWALCTFCLAISLHALYFFTITDASSPRALSMSPWSSRILTTAMSLVIFIVRALFIERLRRLYIAQGDLNPKFSLGICLTILLSLADLAGGIAITVQLFSKPDESILHDMGALFETMFAVAVAADLLLTGMLCICLHYLRTGLRRTNSVINFLILYTINTGASQQLISLPPTLSEDAHTGLFPTLAALITLITFVASPHTLLFIPFYIQIANLYFISILASANHREAVRRQIQEPLALDYSAFDRCGAPNIVDSTSRASTPSFVNLNYSGPSPHSTETRAESAQDAEKTSRSSLVSSELDLSDAYSSGSEVILDSVIDIRRYSLYDI
ncbi:hypothetical protein WOLCODRAFT_164888 [Wolfiporia cocos MD-104 SS10]|uniref:DUF6534 domain-containing protein n=1 Tax=Wolfiporia cocos (strain MD-104) TaxID=742152 RepID=A0A2H3JRC8_WOLCO|nr:hypothetical protein WOLCODRAFT_164888 [Wolfiporia cocos MD-104 SS10]